MAGVDYTPAYLDDVGNWIWYHEAVALFEAAAELTGDPAHGRRVGEELVRQHAGTPVATLLRSLGSPEAIYEQLTIAVTKFSTVTEVHAARGRLPAGRSCRRRRDRASRATTHLCDWRPRHVVPAARPLRAASGERRGDPVRAPRRRPLPVHGDLGRRGGRQGGDPHAARHGAGGAAGRDGRPPGQHVRDGARPHRLDDLDAALPASPSAPRPPCAPPSTCSRCAPATESRLHVHHRGYAGRGGERRRRRSSTDPASATTSRASSPRSRRRAATTGGSWPSRPPRASSPTSATCSTSTPATPRPCSTPRPRSTMPAVAMTRRARCSSSPRTSPWPAPERRGRAAAGGRRAGRRGLRPRGGVPLERDRRRPDLPCRDGAGRRAGRPRARARAPRLRHARARPHGRRPRSPAAVLRSEHRGRLRRRHPRADWVSQALVIVPIAASGRFHGILNVSAGRSRRAAAPLRRRCSTSSPASWRRRPPRWTTRGSSRRCPIRRVTTTSPACWVTAPSRRRSTSACGADGPDTTFTLATIDIDDFKRVNDAHGHPVGDEALRHVADALRRSVRDEDSVFRVGGEEFAVLLPGLTPVTPLPVAERLRSRGGRRRRSRPGCASASGSPPGRRTPRTARRCSPAPTPRCTRRSGRARTRRSWPPRPSRLGATFPRRSCFEGRWERFSEAWRWHSPSWRRPFRPRRHRRRGPTCSSSRPTTRPSSRCGSWPTSSGCSPPRARRSRTRSWPTRSAAPRARRCSPASTPTTTACSANQFPSGGYYKLDSSNTLAGVAPAGRLPHGAGRQVPQRLRQRNANEVPPGWTEWHGTVDPSTYRFYGHFQRQRGAVHDGNDPSHYQTDVVAGRAEEVIRRLAPAPEPFFLWTTFLAPHAGGRDEPTTRATRHAASGAAPRNRFAGEPLPRPAVVQRGRRRRQAALRSAAGRALSRAPEHADRARELPPAARVAAGGRRGGGAASSTPCGRPASSSAR